MRRWILAGLFGVGLLLAIVADRTATPAIGTLAGLLFLAALIVAATFLPWSRWIPGLAPMPDLFPPLATGRWCEACGQVTAKKAACAHCQDPGRSLAAKWKDRRQRAAARKAPAKKGPKKLPSKKPPKAPKAKATRSRKP